MVAILIKLFSINSSWVEEYYSNGFYIFISRTLRLLFGWLPFSIGDLFYTAVVVWLLVWFGRAVKAIFRKQITKQKLTVSLRNFLRLVLIVYIVFNTFWGLNYNRRGIAYQLQLHPQPATQNDLF